MGFNKGGSDSSSQNQSSSQSSTSLDPQILSTIMQNYQRAEGVAGTANPYSGELVAGMTPQEIAGLTGLTGVATSGTGNQSLADATNSETGLTGYKAPTVAYNPFNATMASAASINPNSVTNVNYQAPSAAAINGYLNPFTNDVVNTTNSDLMRQQQIADQGNTTQAAAEGAFGGDRSAVLQNLTDDSYARATAAQDAALQQSGYTTALGAAQTDAAQNLGAQEANQNTQLGIAGQNAGFQQAANLANAGAANTAAADNAQGGLTASQANQTGSLVGAGVQQTATSGLANLSAQQLSQATSLQQLLAEVGQAYQAQNQAVDTANANQVQTNYNNNMALQQLISQALGLAGDPTLAQSTSSSSGSSNSNSSNTGLNLSSIFGSGK